MPRNIQKHKKNPIYGNYSPEQVNEAVKAVSSKKMKLRQAAEYYNVPFQTIHRRVNGKHLKKNGKPTILSLSEEKELVQTIKVASDFGYPLTPKDIGLLVKSYLDSNNITKKGFKNNLPGYNWYSLFMSRWDKELSVRICQNKKSARCVTRDDIVLYFKELNVSMLNVQPTHVINYDETNITDDPGTENVRKVIYKVI